MAEQPTTSSPSADAIEAEIAETRVRLARTIDELAVRAQPREIVRRQTELAKEKLADSTQVAKEKIVESTHTPAGELRKERVGAMAAAGSIVVFLLALRRRHRR